MLQPPTSTAAFVAMATTQLPLQAVQPWRLGDITPRSFRCLHQWLQVMLVYIYFLCKTNGVWWRILCWWWFIISLNILGPLPWYSVHAVAAQVKEQIIWFDDSVHGFDICSIISWMCVNAFKWFGLVVLPSPLICDQWLSLCVCVCVLICKTKHTCCSLYHY